MKMLFSLLMFSAAFVCGETAEKKEETTKHVTAVPENNAQDMLVGEVTKNDLLQPPYAAWFQQGFKEYTPSAEAMEVIKNNISEYEIKVFMGTWCPDSRREVPKLFKILELADYDLDKLTMTGLDYSKSAPGNPQADYDIKRVPTFIFFKDGKEVDRFVEYPQETIAKDIAAIVSEEEYKHSYEN